MKMKENWVRCVWGCLPHHMEEKKKKEEKKAYQRGMEGNLCWKDGSDEQ